MRIFALALVVAGCTASPATRPAGPRSDQDQQGGSGGAEALGGSGGDDGGAGGDMGGAGGSAGDAGGGSGGTGGNAEGACGEAGAGGDAGSFELEAAFVLPRYSRYAQLGRPLSAGGYQLVDIGYDPTGLQSLTLNPDGIVFSADHLTDGFPTWSGAFVPGGGFVALLRATQLAKRPELGSSRILARFGDDGSVTWAQPIDPPVPAGVDDNDVLLSLSSGDLLAFLADEVEATPNPVPNDSFVLARWSADGTPQGRVKAGLRLDHPALLELTDGRVLLLVQDAINSTVGNEYLERGTTAVEVLPSLGTQPLARLTSGIVSSSKALTRGGFAVSGPLIQGERTTIGPGQTGQVVYDGPDVMEAFVAVFDGAGTLRWARRTREANALTWANVLGALPDGGLVVRIDGFACPGVETGDGTFRSVPGGRALAVFGPEGDLRVLQAEPAPGENEDAVIFDTASLTLLSQGDLFTSVVLGAGQPGQTTLRSPTTPQDVPTLAVYRYQEH